MTNKRLKKWSGIGAAGLGLLMVLVLLWPAVRGMSGTAPEQNVDMVSKIVSKIERIQTYFIEEKLKDTLDLSNAQTKQLISVLKVSNAKRAEVVREKVRIIDQLERDELHGDALKAALQKIEELDHRFYDLQRERQDELRRVLNDEQVAKYLVMRRQFIRKIIDVVKPLL